MKNNNQNCILRAVYLLLLKTGFTILALDATTILGVFKGEMNGLGGQTG